jgi:AraC-like DNA-binding protein
MNSHQSERKTEFKAFAPSKDLQPFIHRYMYGHASGNDSVSITVFPSGGLFLSYVAGGPLRIRIRGRDTKTRSRLFIGGQLRKESPVLTSEGQFRLLGVEFRPPAFYRLFHRHADAFTDDMTEFAEVFPRLAETLESHCSPDHSIEQLIAAIEDFVRSLLPDAGKAPIVEAAIARISERQGLISVGDLALLTGYSARQLNRYFTSVVGIPPKHYAKIAQIHSVISAMKATDVSVLQALSLEYGYFDHAHFVRDFQRLVHTNPCSFLRDRSAFLHTYMGNFSC